MWLLLRLLTRYLGELVRETRSGWDRFWFTPSDPATLGLVRILAGGMVFYTHFVWTFQLSAFFGRHSWQNARSLGLVHGDSFHWSHLWWCQSPGLLWSTHLLTLGICLCLCLGLWTRVTSILAWLLTISYAQRSPDAMYGLDQINSFLTLYLAIGPSGEALSLDRWLLRRRLNGQLPAAAPSSGANLALRLMQVHLCVVYLFAGLSKLQGPAWWDGTAFWGALANQEYQTLDLTWLVHAPLLVNVLTHATVAWEISYCALIWHRLTRPLMIALAVPVHLGIGLALGMPTFGLVMLIANVAFVSPQLVRLCLGHASAIANPTETTSHQDVTSKNDVLSGPHWSRNPVRAAADRA